MAPYRTYMSYYVILQNYLDRVIMLLQFHYGTKTLASEIQCLCMGFDRSVYVASPPSSSKPALVRKKWNYDISDFKICS